MRVLISMALVAATLPAMAAALTDETVTLQSDGQDVIGTLMRPDIGPAPVVLLLHGFTGSRDEMTIPGTGEGIFVHAAKALAEAGYASLRIDFRGSGDSVADFTYEATTFESQITDALAAVDFLGKLDTVVGEEIHVIGWSQGGLVASAVAGRHAGLDGVALWQAVGDPAATYGAIMGAQTLAAGEAAAPEQTVTAMLPWGAQVDLDGAFFDGIETFDAMAEIAAYPGPLFVTQGMLDTTVLPMVPVAFITAHDGPEELWTADMDHAFNVFTDTKTLDEMIAATIAFFEANDG